jgi:hypothetical protein
MRAASSNNLADLSARIEVMRGVYDAQWASLPDKIALAIGTAAQSLTPRDSHAALEARVASITETKANYQEYRELVSRVEALEAATHKGAGKDEISRRVIDTVNDWARAMLPYIVAAGAIAYSISSGGS